MIRCTTRSPQYLRDFYATEEGTAYSDFSIGALNDVNIDTANQGDGLGMLICGVPFGDPRYVNEILSSYPTQCYFNGTLLGQ